MIHMMRSFIAAFSLAVAPLPVLRSFGRLRTPFPIEISRALWVEA